MKQSTDKALFPPIEKKEWERILQVMNRYNRLEGFVDFDSNGKMQFYDSDPFINQAHAMPVDLKNIQKIIDSYEIRIKKQTINLKCETCGIDYEKPEDFKKWNDEHPNVFFKWSLMFCDNCRRKNERQALKRLPEVLIALSNSFEK